MKTLYLMLIVSLIPVFIFSLLFFVLVIQLLDIFSNLWRYLAQDVSILEILYIALIYTPKCITYSLPAALLFTVSFTMGSLYKNNELIAILGSGISLYRLVAPFIAIGIILSIGSFFFEDRVVIDSFKQKNEIYRGIVHQIITYSNTNITVISGDARIVYQVDYYNDQRETITNALILIRGPAGVFKTRIDAEWGEWNGTNWVLNNCRIYEWDQERAGLIDKQIGIYDRLELSEPPETFRKTTRNIDEMKRREARRWIERLIKAGLPYRKALTEYYKKFFFALSPFIVTLIASGFGGRFKKNILLMNLLGSLVIIVIYYVMQMMSLILAKNGYIHPLAGAGTSFILFLIVGIFMLKSART